MDEELERKLEESGINREINPKEVISIGRRVEPGYAGSIDGVSQWYKNLAWAAFVGDSNISETEKEFLLELSKKAPKYAGVQFSAKGATEKLQSLLSSIDACFKEQRESKHDWRSLLAIGQVGEFVNFLRGMVANEVITKCREDGLTEVPGGELNQRISDVYSELIASPENLEAGKVPERFRLLYKISHLFGIALNFEDFVGLFESGDFYEYFFQKGVYASGHEPVKLMVGERHKFDRDAKILVKRLFHQVYEDERVDKAEERIMGSFLYFKYGLPYRYHKVCAEEMVNEMMIRDIVMKRSIGKIDKSLEEVFAELETIWDSYKKEGIPFNRESMEGDLRLRYVARYLLGKISENLGSVKMDPTVVYDALLAEKAFTQMRPLFNILNQTERREIMDYGIDENNQTVFNLSPLITEISHAYGVGDPEILMYLLGMKFGS